MPLQWEHVSVQSLLSGCLRILWCINSGTIGIFWQRNLSCVNCCGAPSIMGWCCEFLALLHSRQPHVSHSPAMPCLSSLGVLWRGNDCWRSRDCRHQELHQWAKECCATLHPWPNRCWIVYCKMPRRFFAMSQSYWTKANLILSMHSLHLTSYW